jgi:hypothetical protein
MSAAGSKMGNVVPLLFREIPEAKQEIRGIKRKAEVDRHFYGAQRGAARVSALAELDMVLATDVCLRMGSVLDDRCVCGASTKPVPRARQGAAARGRRAASRCRWTRATRRRLIRECPRGDEGRIGSG